MVMPIYSHAYILFHEKHSSIYIIDMMKSYKKGENYPSKL